MPGSTTMNPCSPSEFEELISHIKNDLNKNISEKDSTWLRDAAGKRNVPVVAVGGETSAFKLCSVVFGRSTEISPADLRNIAREKFLGKNDQEILDEFSNDGKVIRQHHIAIGKLALITAVMETFSIPHFAFHQSVGSCNGLAAMEEAWTSGNNNSKL